MDIKINRSKILRHTNALIDLLNGGSYGRKQVSKAVSRLYKYIDPLDYFSNFINERILDRLKVAVIPNIPGFKDDNSYHLIFVTVIFGILAKRSNIGDMLKIVQKVRERKRGHIYAFMAENLPTKLYDYVGSQLSSDQSEPIILLDYLVFHKRFRAFTVCI